MTSEELAAKLGVTRNKRIVVPCSHCGMGCYAVEPLGCLCVACYAKELKRQSRRSTQATGGK